VWGSEITAKAVAIQGDSEEIAPALNVKLGAAEDHKSMIYVRVFVVLLRAYSQWELVRKTARMVSS
jgi:hypothetical protein